MDRDKLNKIKESSAKLQESIDKPFVRKTRAQLLRESSGSNHKTVADSIMDEAERLKDHVQSLEWHTPIPSEDRKILKKEGFTVVDGHSTITITW